MKDCLKLYLIFAAKSKAENYLEALPLLVRRLGSIPSSGETCPHASKGVCRTEQGGLAWHTEHNNYVPLHINLLVSYISGMKSRPALPHLTQVYLTKHTTPNRALCPPFYSFPKDLLASLFI
jgi:hypothetical protein